MTADQDRERQLARIAAKIQPERIRATLAFAGLYQLTHELIKAAVVPRVKSFYWRGFDEAGMLYDEDAYRQQVLRRDRRVVRASLLWLVEAEAIILAQADRLDEIYAHRHELTHGLGNYLIDPDIEPNMDLFIDAVAILRDISRFWTQIEIDIGSFEEHGEVSVDEVTPGSLLLLQMCIDSYAEGLPKPEE